MKTQKSYFDGETIQFLVGKQCKAHKQRPERWTLVQDRKENNQIHNREDITVTTALVLSNLSSGINQKYFEQELNLFRSLAFRNHQIASCLSL